MSEYAELMPCSYNTFKEQTGIEEPEVLEEFGKALNVFRLAVQAEREKREREDCSIRPL